MRASRSPAGEEWAGRRLRVSSGPAGEALVEATVRERPGGPRGVGMAQSRASRREPRKGVRWVSVRRGDAKGRLDSKDWGRGISWGEDQGAHPERRWALRAWSLA